MLLEPITSSLMTHSMPLPCINVIPGEKIRMVVGFIAKHTGPTDIKIHLRLTACPSQLDLDSYPLDVEEHLRLTVVDRPTVADRAEKGMAEQVELSAEDIWTNPCSREKGLARVVAKEAIASSVQCRRSYHGPVTECFARGDAGLVVGVIKTEPNQWSQSCIFENLNP